MGLLQRAILDKLVVDANPLAVHHHLDVAIHDTPRRWSAVMAVAATFAVRAYQGPTSGRVSARAGPRIVPKCCTRELQDTHHKQTYRLADEHR